MIYLITALYCEAQPFIRQFHMVKNLENTRFQEFYQEAAGIRLVVTGVGEIAAAVAVGSIGTEYRPQEGDVLLNIGICAHMAGGMGVFLCNKITELATGKNFYPDILYKHTFCEEAIVSGMLPWNGERDSGGFLAGAKAKLYDMEAAAIYQAGSYFFGPHQMFFLKVVSDGGNAAEVSGEQVTCIMEAHREKLCGFIRQLSAMGKKSCQFCEEQRGGIVFEKLSADMHCSEVMKNSLRQHIRYLTLAGIDYMPVVQDMYREGLLPCEDKRKGKLCLEEFKRRLFFGGAEQSI